MSDCTDGFPTLFHIDKVVGNTKLETRDRRQVVIPDINFSCNGTITRWIVGARWRGNTNAYTELQIWRRTSTTNQYMKVNGTSIMVSGQNTSEVYELETSLAFQEGDVLGYFQPPDMRSQVDLYLENSGLSHGTTHLAIYTLASSRKELSTKARSRKSMNGVLSDYFYKCEWFLL